MGTSSQGPTIGNVRGSLETVEPAVGGSRGLISVKANQTAHGFGGRMLVGPGQKPSSVSSAGGQRINPPMSGRGTYDSGPNGVQNMSSRALQPVGGLIPQAASRNIAPGTSIIQKSK